MAEELDPDSPGERKRELVALTLAIIGLVVAAGSFAFTFEASRTSQIALTAASRLACQSALTAELDKFYAFNVVHPDPKDRPFSEYGFAWTSADRVGAACTAGDVIPEQSGLATAMRGTGQLLANAWTYRAKSPYAWYRSVDYYNRILLAWPAELRAALKYVRSLPSPTGLPAWLPFQPDIPRADTLPSEAKALGSIPPPG